MATIEEMIQNAQRTNSREAYEEIANIYYYGRGVPNNQSLALNYYKKAAELGSVNAQFCTGFMYYYGQGTTKDCKLAKKYLQSAADCGSVGALHTLGWMCYNGDYGFLAGKGKAFEYWMKASKLGVTESQLFIATSYLGDTWGEEKSYRKAAFWFMCAYLNRKATDAQIKQAKEKLDMLAQSVNLNAVRNDVLQNYPRYINA